MEQKPSRTMLAHDPARAREWDRSQKLCDDPRITRTGRWLRATSLDELPYVMGLVRQAFEKQMGNGGGNT